MKLYRLAGLYSLEVTRMRGGLIEAQDDKGARQGSCGDIFTSRSILNEGYGCKTRGLSFITEVA